MRSCAGCVLPEEAVLGDIFEEVPEKVYTCPACRGRHRPHTRDHTCRLGEPTISAMSYPVDPEACVPEGSWFEEELQDDDTVMFELSGEKDSGATTLPLKDVKHAIGADREGWRLALHAELQSLWESGAMEVATDVPRGVKPLPMKLVTTIKPVDGSELKKKKARAVVCGNFQQSMGRSCSTQRTRT